MNIKLVFGIIVAIVVIGAGAYWHMQPSVSPSISASNTASTTASDEKPTCQITANKSTARPGEPISFSWMSTGAEYAANYSPDYKSIAEKDKMSANGSSTETVDPTFLDPNFQGPLSFTLFFVGPAGFTSCSVTVPVAGSTEKISSLPDYIALSSGAKASSADQSFSIQLNSLASTTAQITTIISGTASTVLINLQENPTQLTLPSSADTFYINYCGILKGQILLMVSKNKAGSCPSYLG